MRNNQKINFIHINKTAGTSIGKALNLPFQHKTAEEVITEIGLERWNNSYNFTFVRNPWDKVVSHYFHRVKTNQTNMKKNPISFTDWVIESYGENNPKYYDKPKMFMPQYDWLIYRSKLVVNNIFRFENLKADYFEICKILKVVQRKLDHKNKSQRDHFRLYYNNVTAEIIREWFLKDISLFNYKFKE